MNIFSSIPPSCALRISTAAAILIAGGCSAAKQQPEPHAQPPLTRPVFAARAIASEAQRHQIAGSDKILGLTIFDTDLESIYNTINPEKSIFIHDCGGWCNDSFYYYSSWLKTAATVVDAAHPDKVAATFRQSLLAQIPSAPNPDTLVFQAVANRLDLAVSADGTACRGAELHLVYASPDPAINFRLILEYVLPSTTDLHALAKQW